MAPFLFISQENIFTRGKKLSTEFTPVSAFLGGCLIGLSAVLLMYFHGRIAGISGILKKLLPPFSKQEDSSLSLNFILGLMLAMPIYSSLAGPISLQLESTNTSVVLLSGLLVGIGVSVGNGCTSGHGVCGISRFSIRSIVATAIFLLSAMVTVFLTRHIIG